MATLKPSDVDRVVREIDATRETEFWRDPDRPDSRVFRGRGRVPKEVVRAQTRLRTAHWRIQMDRRKAPTAEQIGMSVLYALITSRMSELTFTDRDLLARALMDLQARGFSVVEAKATLRRMRNRYVDPADRDAETSKCTGPAMRLSGVAGDLPF